MTVPGQRRRRRSTDRRRLDDRLTAGGLVVGSASLVGLLFAMLGAAGAADRPAASEPSPKRSGARSAVASTGPRSAVPPAVQGGSYANMGFNRCADCHEQSGRHDQEVEWYHERDGTGDGRQHQNSLSRLEEDPRKSRRYVEAAQPGVGDDWQIAMYDAGGPCIECHGTVVKGFPEAVSCEACHGPGEGYLEPHKEEGSYRTAVEQFGMWDVVENPSEWARVCMECHVLDDSSLIAAEHPSGDDFDLGVKFAPVADHFIKASYTAGEIRPLGQQWLAQIQDRREPLAGAPTGAGGDEAETAAGTPEPEPEPEEPAAEPEPATRAEEAPPPPPPAQPPTTRVEVVEVPRFVTSDGILVDPDVAGADPLPQTPTGVVAQVQGRLIALLADLLRRNARTPIQVVPPEAPTTYRGADAELLRLQEQVIALALEALGIAPVEPRDGQDGR